MIFIGAAKINKRCKEKWKRGKSKLKELLQSALKVTICIDGWSKKGLSCSFFGVSACFYAPSKGKVMHAVLQVIRLKHPHTGRMLAAALKKCLTFYGLDASRILMIVTDNGSNMIKLVKVLNDEDIEENGEEQDTESSSSEDEDGTAAEQSEVEEENNNTETETEVADEEDEETTAALESTIDQLAGVVHYMRMPCIAHTLQLVVKKFYSQHYDGVIGKARHIVGRIRKSSVAIQYLIRQTGKTVISDNTTRWNSTFYMCKRLIALKPAVAEVLTKHVEMDNLLVSEWNKLEELTTLLEPFAVITNLLQSDARSLSYMFPSLLELECHLSTYQPATGAARKVIDSILKDFHARFAAVLRPDSEDEPFNPVPVAACLLDPEVGKIMMLPENKRLQQAAKEYIISEV